MNPVIYDILISSNPIQHPNKDPMTPFKSLVTL